MTNLRLVWLIHFMGLAAVVDFFPNQREVFDRYKFYPLVKKNEVISLLEFDEDFGKTSNN